MVFSYRAGEIWKTKGFIAVIFFIGQIKTNVTILKCLGMYDILNKHIYYKENKTNWNILSCRLLDTIDKPTATAITPKTNISILPNTSDSIQNTTNYFTIHTQQYFRVLFQFYIFWLKTCIYIFQFSHSRTSPEHTLVDIT